MKGIIECPIDFELYDDILCDDYGNLKEQVRDAIYMQPLIAYLGLDDTSFCAVYWNDTIGYWCGDLWMKEGYVITYICDSPEEIKEEILADYVDRWENWR